MSLHNLLPHELVTGTWHTHVQSYRLQKRCTSPFSTKDTAGPCWLVVGGGGWRCTVSCCRLLRAHAALVCLPMEHRLHRFEDPGLPARHAACREWSRIDQSLDLSAAAFRWKMESYILHTKQSFFLASPFRMHIICQRSLCALLVCLVQHHCVNQKGTHPGKQAINLPLQMGLLAIQCRSLAEALPDTQPKQYCLEGVRAYSQTPNSGFSAQAFPGWGANSRPG